MKKWMVNLLFSFSIVLFVLLIWYMAAWIIDVDLILPTPLAAFKSLFAYLGSSAFYQALFATIGRGIISFLAAFLIALGASLASYAFPLAKKTMRPLMGFIRAIPTMSVILIVILWLSPAYAPLLIAAIVICPTLYSSFLAGFEQIDLNLIEMAYLYQVPRIKKIKQMYLPNMAPVLFENSASGISLTIKLVIAAEALAQTGKSIGQLMQYSKIALEMEKLFALTIVAVFISLFLEWLIRLIGRKVVRIKHVETRKYL
ncbi:MAG TPA: ABC transporter permease subunit [Candidatus Pelethenecus faecipullorum]|uniref:ABC transporter permease subunit n=1 Tax=Candidatus Pelethenecus faecipullorum TaxID=2840900 RepID=A0A9D1GQ46_9MOLU|nr:ABC transporter permease subunit [Candidatus Pelethenecus faecipullorum]